MPLVANLARDRTTIETSGAGRYKITTVWIVTPELTSDENAEFSMQQALFVPGLPVEGDRFGLVDGNPVIATARVVLRRARIVQQQPRFYEVDIVYETPQNLGQQYTSANITEKTNTAFVQDLSDPDPPNHNEFPPVEDIGVSFSDDIQRPYMARQRPLIAMTLTGEYGISVTSVGVIDLDADPPIIHPFNLKKLYEGHCNRDPWPAQLPQDPFSWLCKSITVRDLNLTDETYFAEFVFVYRQPGWVTQATYELNGRVHPDAAEDDNPDPQGFDSIENYLLYPHRDFTPLRLIT